jgi:hypothetical protein
VEAAVELGADFAWDAGDFSGAGHGRERGKIIKYVRQRTDQSYG